MGGGAEPKSRPSRLAFHHRQCPHETETFVSKDSCLTEYYAIEDANGSRYVVFDLTAPFGNVQVLWATGSLHPVRFG